MQVLSPALYIVSTPIGNLEDITLRSINILQKCDFIICENTKVTGNLLKNLQIKKPLLIYNDHSNNFTREKILNYILQGKILALVSDAGTPLISDPGYKLVNFLHENNCKIFSVPGPCSAIAALSISGIASDRFMFAGFIPVAKKSREDFYKELLTIKSTLIFFETSRRLISSLEIMLKIFGNRKAAVVREITKIYEETKRDSLENLVNYYRDNPVKGEIVIVVSPPKKNKEVDMAEIEKEIKKNLGKFKPKELVAMIADNFGVGKKPVYGKMLEITQK